MSSQFEFFFFCLSQRKENIFEFDYWLYQDFHLVLWPVQFSSFAFGFYNITARSSVEYCIFMQLVLKKFEISMEKTREIERDNLKLEPMEVCVMQMNY